MTLPRRLAALLMMLALTVTGFAAPQAAPRAHDGHEPQPPGLPARPGASRCRRGARHLPARQPAHPADALDLRRRPRQRPVRPGRRRHPRPGHRPLRPGRVQHRRHRPGGRGLPAALAPDREHRQPHQGLRAAALGRLPADRHRRQPRPLGAVDAERRHSEPQREPVELPDPSDSGASYWQARSLWAFGEGYAAFRRSDPAFAAFLQQRIQLSVGALERDVLSRYGHYEVADGRRVPAWLIVDGADATAEAVLGLAAYARVAPGDAAARRALARFAEGIADMSAGTRQQWPYDAILPWTQSRSLWHAWASQTGAALARAAATLDRRRWPQPAVAEALSFDPTLLTGDGADNGWLPAPVDTGADRLRRRLPGAVPARCRRHHGDGGRRDARRAARVLVLRRQPRRRSRCTHRRPG